MPEDPGGDVDQCVALTNAGTRCTRPAGDDGFCYQHDATIETIDLAAAGQPAAGEPDDQAEHPVDRTDDRSAVGDVQDDGGSIGTAHARPEAAAADADEADLTERLKDRTRRQYDEGTRLLREGRDTAEERGRAGLEALREWYDTRLVPALQSAREGLRQRVSGASEGRSTERK